MNLRRQDSQHITLEICIDSVESAMSAERGGGNRLELCANLIEGGTTPSSGMIQSVLAASQLPVMVMIRSRGGHFCYSRTEKDTMLREAEAVLSLPVAGIVFGALTEAGDIDEPFCRQLCQLAEGRSLTFHRAFDQVRDASAALPLLVSLGVPRVLTSGQAPTAPEGLETLSQWVEQFGAAISIMPGCGVRANNVDAVVRATGVQEVHCSAGRTEPSPTGFWRDAVPMSARQTIGDLNRRVTDAEHVALIRARLDGLGG